MLQDNDPAAGRWYSRDVAAIAAAQGLQGPVAPFFVDAQAAADPAAPGRAAASRWCSFRNHHLVYAFTWFVLAALVAGRRRLSSGGRAAAAPRRKGPKPC